MQPTTLHRPLLVPTPAPPQDLFILLLFSDQTHGCSPPQALFAFAQSVRLPQGSVTGGPGVCPGWGARGGGPLQVTTDYSWDPLSTPPARKLSEAPRETLDPESAPSSVLSLGLQDECGNGCREAQGRSTSALTSSSEAAPPEGSGHLAFCDLFLPPRNWGGDWVTLALARSGLD